MFKKTTSKKVKAGELSQVLLDLSRMDGSPGHQPGGKQWPGSALPLGQVYKHAPKRGPVGSTKRQKGRCESWREKGVSLLPPASALY